MHLYDIYDGTNFKSLMTNKDNGELRYMIGNYMFNIHTYNNELIEYIDMLKTDNLYDDIWYDVLTTNPSKAIDDKGTRIKGSLYKRSYMFNNSNLHTDDEIMDTNTDNIAYPLGLQVFLTSDADVNMCEELAKCCYSLATNPNARYWMPSTHYMITNNYPYRYFE